MTSCATIAVGSIFLVLVAICGQVAAQNIENPDAISADTPDGDLLLVQCLWRHGDRTPASFLNGDPYSDPSNWPVGLGELTNTGKRQHFAVGQWLRADLNGFLPQAYSENDTYVRSTDYDRTLASAYSNLAGLYPPRGDQVWNENLEWQPIPVHTVGGSTDYIIGANIVGCPSYDVELAKVVVSPEITRFVRAHQNMVDYIAENTGADLNISIIAMTYVAELRDNLYIETLYGKPLENWTKAIYPSAELDSLALRSYLLGAYTTKLARVRVGYFLQEVLDRATAKVNGTMSPDRKLWIYSAHDSNIASVLYGMGVFDNKFVHYAAMLMFKLYKGTDGEVYLSLSYRKHWDDETAAALEMPTCGFKCKLTDYYVIFADILPTQSFEDECSL